MSGPAGMPPDQVMREMSKLAMEAAAEFFANMATEFADSPLLVGASAQEAMVAFARAIRDLNSKHFPVPKVRS